MEDAKRTEAFHVTGVSLNTRTYRPKDHSARITQYQKDKALRENALVNKLPFIHPSFVDFFSLCQGLILIGAKSGQGKSTLVGNIITGFFQYSTGEALVISNEETSEAVYNRAACTITGDNFIKMHNRQLPRSAQLSIEAKATEIMSRIEVVDDAAWDMTCLEDVQAVLEFAAERKVKLVVIDYIQTVTHSREKPHLEPMQVSKLLGYYLKEYGKKVGIPTVAFAQLKPKEEAQDFASRVQNDKTIYNHAFDAMEIVPDFKNKTTKFILHKNRFGTEQGKECTALFNYGRFEMLEEV